MKKFHFISALAISALLITACGNNSGAASTADSTATTKDSIPTVIAPADNSSATNPSLADTAFAKKDTLKDTSKMKH